MSKKICFYMILTVLCLCGAVACGKEEKILLAEEEPAADKAEGQETGEGENEGREPEAAKEENEGRGPETAKEEDESREPEATAGSGKESREICVYLCGAVKNPGVYYLEEGARLYEGIEAAGGFAGEADESWWNQAAQLADGTRVEIYTREETEAFKSQGLEAPASPGAGQDRDPGADDPREDSAASGENKGLVDINTATSEELQTIPGIGQVKAGAILSYREEIGHFTSVEQIQEVPGIKGKTYDKIKSYITC